MASSRTALLASIPSVKREVAADGDAPRRVPEGMAGLAKGLAILEAFNGSQAELTVADAARAAAITRASARRCLLTLVDLGYLEHDGKLFRPLPRLLRLGRSYLNAAPLPRIAQPLLDAARDELGESVSLAILVDHWSVFVARAEAVRIVSTGVSIGARLPAYCSATGRILLGALSDEAIASYLESADIRRLTPKTVTDRAKLRMLVEAGLRDEVAMSDEELELGMRSMAVPVRNASGRIVAAMSLSASSARIACDAMMSAYLPVLRRFARALGDAL